MPREDTQFKPGQSGNPAGRSPGSKDKFQRKFWEDLARIWDESGAVALAKVLQEDTSTFVRVAAGLLPKEEEHKHTIESIRWQTEEEALRLSRTTPGDSFDLSTIDARGMPLS
jgi:hypothetical protein